MKLFRPAAAALTALALASTLSGCITDQIGAAYHVATSASISRNQAILVAQSMQTVQDIDTATTNGCVGAKGLTGICAPAGIEAAHKALLASRTARDALLAFAANHAGAELGASGLYDAAVTAKNALVSVLQQYGVAVPASAAANPSN
jgi:hypothetical protein